MSHGSPDAKTAVVVSREEWADLLCAKLVEVDVDFDASTRFVAEIDQRTAGNFSLTKVFSTAQKSVRTRSRISSSSNDDFFLRLQLAGRGKVNQGGRTALLNPGDFTIWDNARPYDVCCNENFGLIVLRIPRIIMEQKLVDPKQFTATAISCSRGIGRLASTFICELFGQIEEVDELSLARVYSSAIDLITGAILEQSGATPDVTEAHIRLRRATIAYIERNISDHNLNCAAIAAALGVSTRHLRHVFGSAPYGVSDLIWGRRLEQAQYDLADPFKAHISVTGIAYDVGFKDSAHFSRAFKAAFGATPGAYRAASAHRTGVDGGAPANKRPYVRGQGRPRSDEVADKRFIHSDGLRSLG